MVPHSERYQPGGDFYAALLTQYGVGAATDVAQAARTGDVADLNAALSRARKSARQGTAETEYDTEADAENQRLARYAPGGDIYNSLADEFGQDAANGAYRASLTGDRADLNRALSLARTAQRRGITFDQAQAQFPDGDESTARIFGHQITSDPLSAPLDALNSQLSKAAWNFAKNPMVLLLVAVGLFFYFGGLGTIKRKVANVA